MFKYEMNPTVRRLSCKANIRCQVWPHFMEPRKLCAHVQNNPSIRNVLWIW